MEKNNREVISASRRTDIPAFYMDWFMAQVAQGYFEVFNPYNNRVSKVSAGPDSVHTFVFWSKNFGPFIGGDYARKLEQMGYNLFFNFTINSEDSLLEPNVPPLGTRLEQLKHLCQHFVPESVQWRFDPICFYQAYGSRIQDNLKDFERIADYAAKVGVKRCVTSFVDDYPKIQRRLSGMDGFSFCDPPMEKKLELVQNMEEQLARRGISLFTCCERETLERLPEDTSISKSSCIPNSLLARLFGGRISMKDDMGQRVEKGCGCKVSRDIGSYRLHPCFHNCLFCYANPSAGFQNAPS